MQLGLRTKLTITMVLTTSLVIGLFYFFIVREVRKVLLNGAINRGLAVTESLVEQVQQGLDRGYLEDLRFSFRRIADGRQEVVYMMLLDLNGRVIVHSDPRVEGLQMEDPISEAVLRSRRSLIQRYRADMGTGSGLEDVYDISVPVLLNKQRWGSFRTGVSFHDKVAESISAAVNRITLLSVAGVGLAVLIALVISVLLVRPLRRLMHITREVEQGNLRGEFRFPKSKDEIGLLAASFSRMLEKLKEGYERIEKISITDSLTGCYNYHYFAQIMEKEMVRANRYAHAVSLIILDLDRFKELNDRHGHLKGNEVLKRVAGVIANTIRQTDVLVRYGGDEFVVLLPETGKAGAALEAERVRKEVEKRCVFEWDNVTWNLTISVGMASLENPPMDKTILLEAADKALLQAKAYGKNRVGVHQA